MPRLLASITLFACLLGPATVARAAPAGAPGLLLVHPSGARGVSALGRSPQVAATAALLPGGVRLVTIDGDTARAAARLRRTRGIGWVEPDDLVHALATPDDPLFPQQTDLAVIGAPAGWDALGLGGFPATGGVPVGIVDTGIDQGHPDLAGRVAACATAEAGTVTEGACADDEGHGSHVAGTIGAAANDGGGIAGVAFDAPLIVCRALTADGGGDVAGVAACIRWAHQRGAKVISMSLGGADHTRTLAAAVRDAYARGSRAGSLLVAAAGNDGDGRLEFPAGLPQVISVAATDDHDQHAVFSNVNADVEISAPGVDVLSVRMGGGHVRESGTSMATPHVSAAAALIWGSAPSLSAAAVRGRLDRAVVDLGAPGRDPVYGFGRLDLGHLG